MPLSTLVLAGLDAFWRTVLMDLLKQPVLKTFKTLTAADLDSLFEKAVKRATVDLTSEKAKAIRETIRTSKAVEEKLQAFKNNGEWLDMEFMVKELEPVVGGYTAFSLVRDVFAELRTLIAEQPEMANEILIAYGAQFLKALKQHDSKMTDEHNKLAVQFKAEIDELKKLIKDQTAANPHTGLEAFLHHITIESNRLPLGILEPAFIHPQNKENMQLVNVYTHLDSMDIKHVRDEMELHRFIKTMEENKRLSLQELIDSESRLLILGSPGSGKSTFSNYLSYTLAKAKLDPDEVDLAKILEPWSHGQLVPIRIILREMAEELKTPDPSYTAILHFIEGYLKHRKIQDCWPLLKTWITAPKPAQGLIFFFDGLDELPDAWRHALVKSINTFVEQFPSHRYVVTSRPYAYIGQPYMLQGFRQVNIAPLSYDQIDAFIQSWYKELERLKRIKTEVVDSRIESFQKQVRAKDIKPLVDRPLILTLTALLHFKETGTLPTIRVELYDCIVDLLLDKWQRKGDDQPGLLEILDIPDLEMMHIKNALYKIAYDAHQNQSRQEITANLPEGDLLLNVRDALKVKLNTAQDFIEYIRDRAGMLVRHKPDSFTFPHRIFQEFLAACYWVQQDNFAGQASQGVKDDPVLWREVFILSVARAARGNKLSEALDAVDRLCLDECHEIEQPTKDLYERMILSANALYEIGLRTVRQDEKGKRTLRRLADLDGWLVNATTDDQVLDDPKIRAQAGQVLSKVGDPRPGVGLDLATGLPDILWCPIPGGSFQMGEGGKKDPVSLDLYYISRYPVTHQQFRAFVEQDGYANSRYWKIAEAAGIWKKGKVKGRSDDEWRNQPVDFGEPFHLDNHPVVGITWYEMLAFCEWLNQKLQSHSKIKIWQSGTIKETSLPPHLRVLLPSEAEWERAARAGHECSYPWGDEITPNHANFEETGIDTTSSVGCFPAGENNYGLLDMSGNVWEWTRSHYQSYPYKTNDGRERLSAGNDTARVLRGGSFHDIGLGMRCSSRFRDFPDVRLRFSGFRVVLSPVDASVL
ncbi:SUMF1/EgtB/PvdO family nonheme iron enzyme [candidate division KSB1 bacterium]|nr:SUMF1/EgtB/PvdO family nonheme iron enzyme [candidate division KSB1 bacterium]